jgi:hypothetical protein
MSALYKNHYDYCDKTLANFWDALGINYHNKFSPEGITTAHGDKCYSYKDIWEKNGISFNHGVAIYLLSYIKPYSTEVRETSNGWVDPCEWVINNYTKFKPFLDLCKVNRKNIYDTSDFILIRNGIVFNIYVIQLLDENVVYKLIDTIETVPIVIFCNEIYNETSSYWKK